MPLRMIDAYHTSRWCSRFGAVGYGHSTNNYLLFLCWVCGLIVDSGRKSSLAVCVGAFLGGLKHALANCVLVSRFPGIESL
jgi:hypothetical protein